MADEKWLCKCGVLWAPSKCCPICACRKNWRLLEAAEAKRAEQRARWEEEDRVSRRLSQRLDPTRTIAERRGWSTYR